VLHDIPGGFHCRSCNLVYLPHVDVPA